MKAEYSEKNRCLIIKPETIEEREILTKIANAPNISKFVRFHGLIIRITS